MFIRRLHKDQPIPPPQVTQKNEFPIKKKASIVRRAHQTREIIDPQILRNSISKVQEFKEQFTENLDSEGQDLMDDAELNKKLLAAKKGGARRGGLDSVQKDNLKQFYFKLDVKQFKGMPHPNRDKPAFRYRSFFSSKQISAHRLSSDPFYQAEQRLGQNCEPANGDQLQRRRSSRG